MSKLTPPSKGHGAPKGSEQGGGEPPGGSGGSDEAINGNEANAAKTIMVRSNFMTCANVANVVFFLCSVRSG
jgi:hypothetical protein